METYADKRQISLYNVHNCLSNMSWPNLYTKLLYKLGQDFLDRQ